MSWKLAVSHVVQMSNNFNLRKENVGNLWQSPLFTPLICIGLNYLDCKISNYSIKFIRKNGFVSHWTILLPLIFLKHWWTFSNIQIVFVAKLMLQVPVNYSCSELDILDWENFEVVNVSIMIIWLQYIVFLIYKRSFLLRHNPLG